MWQKFRKREEPIKIYKDKGEPAPDHLPRTAVDGVISWEPVSMHWKIIVSSSGNDAMLSVTARMSTRERGCKDVIVPPPPHPTLPHPASGDDAMLSVAASVSKEGTHLQDVIVPPHPTPPPRIWRRCHVECGSTYVDEGTQLQGRYCPTPTPPHPTPPASGDDAMLSVAASVSKEGTQLPGRYFPTPPHPPHPTPPNPTPPHLERMPCWVWPQVWRGFWFLNLVDGGCGIVFFWLRNRVFWFRNRLFLVAESSFFGCGIVFFWLRKRLFLVAGAYMFSVAESPKFGCGSVEIWFRNRNLFW